MLISSTAKSANVEFSQVVQLFAPPTNPAQAPRVPGLFVPKTFRSQERIVPMGNFHSRDFSFPGTFVPVERKFKGTFVPRTFRSEELSFPGFFVLRNFRSSDYFTKH